MRCCLRRTPYLSAPSAARPARKSESTASTAASDDLRPTDAMTASRQLRGVSRASLTRMAGLGDTRPCQRMPVRGFSRYPTKRRTSLAGPLARGVGVTAKYWCRSVMEARNPVTVVVRVRVPSVPPVEVGWESDFPVPCRGYRLKRVL